jgi:citrate lyase subunit beta / citryl-CoA lyase
MRGMKLPVTYLFVPGNRPERFGKALASGADAIVLDLEDAVSPQDKALAREAIARWLESQPGDPDRVVVRINDESTAWLDADVELLRRSAVALAMLPKTESAGQVEAVRSALVPAGKVVPLIETARGVSDAASIASANGVQRLAFGTLDYAVDLGLSGDERGLIHPSAAIASASRCAGIAAPIAGVTAAIDDDQALLADVAFARAFGFGAKLCIHPRQLAAVRKAFLPTSEEVEWARLIVSTAEASSGVVQVGGRMVDRPVLLKARAILDRANPGKR